MTNNNTIISPSACVVRSAAIRQGNSNGAGVISQNTVCHVDTICVFCTNLSCVCPGTCALRTKKMFQLQAKESLVMFHMLFYDCTF